MLQRDKQTRHAVRCKAEGNKDVTCVNMSCSHEGRTKGRKERRKEGEMARAGHEDGQDKTRQDKREQKKTREDNTREARSAPGERSLRRLLTYCFCNNTPLRYQLQHYSTSPLDNGGWDDMENGMTIETTQRRSRRHNPPHHYITLHYITSDIMARPSLS